MRKEKVPNYLLHRVLRHRLARLHRELIQSRAFLMGRG